MSQLLPHNKWKPLIFDKIHNCLKIDVSFLDIRTGDGGERASHGWEATPVGGRAKHPHITALHQKISISR